MDAFQSWYSARKYCKEMRDREKIDRCWTQREWRIREFTLGKDVTSRKG